MATTTATAVRFAAPVIGPAEVDEVVAALGSGWLSSGPRARQFEAEFAAYVGVPHALALNSCTAALHLALLAYEIGPGDEVVTTPLTFCATANVAVHSGATPRFADIDPVTWTLSPEAAAAAVGAATRAVVPVHFAGRAADMAGFRRLADRHRLAVIDDAAHAVEAVSGGRKIGAAADVTCFSFYATKNLTTGEGGMLTTSSPAVERFARLASQHGISRDGWSRHREIGTPHYDVVFPGFKYNMPDLAAAIGLHQLRGLAARHAHREALWRLYDEALADLPLTRPASVPSGDVHARHLYTVLVRPDSGWTRDALAAHLAAQGIATSVHFRALHLHPYYRDRFRLRRGMFPVAEQVSDEILSLPLWGDMPEADLWTVVDALRRALTGRSR